MSVTEYEVGRQPGPPTRRRIEVDPITLRVLGGAFHAIAKEMAGVLFRMSYSSIIRESEDLGAGHLRRRGPRALRVGLDADAHRLAALVHPRLPAPARRRDRGRRRDRPQPPLPRRLALAGHGRRGADLRRRRAARLRRGDRARARRRRLLPGHQRRRLRRLRRGQALQRPALVPPRRAERGRRPDDLRQRPHGDDEPRRHERDAGRLPARPRPLPAPRRPLRHRDGDERRVRLDGLLRADAPRRDREDPGRHVRPGRRVARRRRAEPRHPAPRRDARDRRGRRGDDRPHRLEPGGADRLQRAVRRVAARLVLLRDPHDPARRDRRSRSTCRRTTASSGR